MYSWLYVIITRMKQALCSFYSYFSFVVENIDILNK